MSKSLLTIGEDSLISREASVAIKGFLMLLIIFGHVGMLTTKYTTGDTTFFRDWLYTFHVHVYMILPFIYGYHRRDETNISINNKVNLNTRLVDAKPFLMDLRCNLIRIGIPFCWFFAFYSLTYFISGFGDFNPYGVAKAFLYGSQPLLMKYIGFALLWFLPAMLALTTLKSLWYNSLHQIKAIILCASIIFWVFLLFSLVERDMLTNNIPFGLAYGLYYLLIGVSTRWVLENYNIRRLIPWTLLGLLVLSVCFYYRWQFPLNPYWLICLLMPALVFFALYSIGEELSKFRLLYFLGTYSLQIYLVHVFVINVLQIVLLHFTHQSILLGIVIYVLALIISAGLSILMMKIPLVNRIVFPKG